MKKMFTAIFTAMLMVSLLSVTAFSATKTVAYYDENGNQISVNGMYYNSQGDPMYNAGCYYLDADGEPVYVGGCQVYYYGADGDLAAGKYYYDRNGKAVARPSSYPGGYGCGAYYYNSQGRAVDATVYYDDFGNRVDPPAETRTGTYGGGRRCGYGYGCGW